MFRRAWKWIKSIFKKSATVSAPSVPVNNGGASSVSDFTPNQYHSHYEGLWRTMEVRDSKKSTIAWYIKTALRNRERYEGVSDKSGVPWEVIACFHLLESGGDFSGVLHNGEKIIGTGRKTRLVPKNRGPFNTWEEAAVDALAIKQQPKEWTIVNTLYYCERYNGLGYLRDSKKPHSPYLWSFSNHYIKGKYIADGRYSSTAVSKQCGVAVILKGLGYEGLLAN